MRNSVAIFSIRTPSVVSIRLYQEKMTLTKYNVINEDSVRSRAEITVSEPKKSVVFLLINNFPGSLEVSEHLYL